MKHQTTIWVQPITHEIVLEKPEKLATGFIYNTNVEVGKIWDGMGWVLSVGWDIRGTLAWDGFSAGYPKGG